MRGFRVWSNYWEKFAIEAELHMDGSVDAIFEDDGGVPHHENTDLVVEFPTGLKDKNGKEIYEGDIVEALIDGVWTTGSNDAMFGKKTWKLEVYWDEMRYAFMWHVLGSKTCPDRVYDLYDRKIAEIEAVDNIHENSGLLEKEEWATD